MIENIYKTEPEYRKDIEKALTADFIIKPEQWVTWPIENKEIRVDFIIEPKEHLKKNGFEANKIAIEVKSPIAKESVKKLLDCISQAHSYTMCKHEGSYIDFILIYPEIHNFFSHDGTHNIGEIRLLHRIMQRANIGALKLTNDSYKISFADCRYYSPEKGRSEIKNLGQVRRIGSRKMMLKS